ncbi:MAG: hypothetical protein HQL65_14500 [Magnetococcales bacterium]|nr:hypothetical protein [Magnetococcales bacterium]
METPVEKVVLRRELLEHVVEKRVDIRESYANYLLPTLKDPYKVWRAKYSDGGMRTHYIGLYQDHRDMLVIARANQDSTLLWNLIRCGETWLDKRRVGELLYGKQG